MGLTVEEIPIIKRQKIEETVINILKDADLEIATELSVRAAAAEQLREDFSDMSYKSFIRKVVESYLLSTASVYNGGDVVLGDKQKYTVTNLMYNGAVESTPGNTRAICKLSDNINVAICDISGQTFVSIQECHQIDGKQLPSGQGIRLTDKQWSTFRDSFSAIDEAIAQMESHDRAGASEKLHKANGVNPVDEIAHEEAEMASQNHMERGDLTCLDQTQDVSHFLDQVPNGTSLPCPLPVDKSQLSSSKNLVPIMTTRLNGKNYNCWKHHMEFFLNQLRVAYVLTCPCPSIPAEPRNFKDTRQVKTARQNWIDDDYLCCHSILNSLTDDLLNMYSKRKYTGAKELWEQLKSEYDEDFGTKRSLVHKYVQFEIVDGVSVTEQVQELNHIANTIRSSGIWVDENFHVSLIISKLPPTWSEFRRKLMHEEYLPLNVLMNRVIVAEEEAKNVVVSSQQKDGSNQNNGAVSMDTQEEHRILHEGPPYNNTYNPSYNKTYNRPHNKTYNRFDRWKFRGKKGGLNFTRRA